MLVRNSGLNWPKLVRTNNISHPENVDVALVVLKPEFSNALAPSALPLSVMSDDAVRDDDFILLTGFPAELTESSVVADAPITTVEFGFTSVTYNTMLKSPSSDEQGRLRVMWSEKIGPTGVPVPMPKPEGISGGALWRFRKVASDAIWTSASGGKIAGVPVAWDRVDTQFVEPVLRWRDWLLKTAASVDTDFG